MASNMRGGWKVNATEYNRQMSIEDQYRLSHQGKAKNGFGIYLVILTFALLLIFG